MNLQEFRSFPDMDGIPVVDANHPVVAKLFSRHNCCHVAETTDLRQLRQLCRRKDYQPLIAITNANKEPLNSVSVVFCRYINPADLVQTYWGPNENAEKHAPLEAVSAG